MEQLDGLAAACTRPSSCISYVEPLTERFLVAGFDPAGIACGDRYLLDVGALMHDRADQTRFTDEVIAPQLDVATAITPPHFFVDTASSSTSTSASSVKLLRWLAPNARWTDLVGWVDVLERPRW